MSLKQIALHVSRDLRKNQTHTELIFWNNVKNKKFMGLKFLRQHPLFYQYYGQKKFFIADFYCGELRLVVEIEGGIHEQQADYDKIRTEIIEAQNEYKVVRFKNEEVLKEIQKVLNRLKNIVINLKKA